MLDVQGHALQALDPRALTVAAARARRRARGGFGWVALLAAACSATTVAPPPPVARGPASADPARPDPAPLVAQPSLRLDESPQVPGAPAGDLTPDILRPAKDSVDAEIARVGDLAVWKRHLFDRLLETNPQQARDLVDSLVLDSLVADLAVRHGIAVSAAEIDKKLAEEERQLRERLAAEWKGQLDFDRYLMQQFGMDAKEWARWHRLTLARTLYRQYVIRYHALRGDRVQVRYIVTSDRGVLEEARKQIKDGASFSRLALRYSEDESRKDGGLLPPFGAGTPHPIADLALGLAAGELSEVTAREVDGQPRYYLVSCLRRLPADARAFAEVRAEIDEDIKARPLTRFDFHAFYFATRAAAAVPSTESLRNGSKPR